ncbi:hypothetical protein, partial [Sulfitobacter sp.]|uniref:hypothetical protein n=1 Tax=Sulfitobacter sp. TaxID=1903071 RepID=UPI00272A6E49
RASIRALIPLMLNVAIFMAAPCIGPRSYRAYRNMGQGGCTGLGMFRLRFEGEATVPTPPRGALPAFR